MKDKRQRMAFTWPYGDPQMLAYMLSAVAASGYAAAGTSTLPNMIILPPAQAASNPIVFQNQHQLNNASFQTQQTKRETPENTYFQSDASTNVSTYSDLNEMQLPLHLNIKTPSPNLTELNPGESIPSFSSMSSSFTGTNNQSLNSILVHHQGNNQNQNNSTSFNAYSNNNKMGSELTSPISLFIPNTFKSQSYPNYDSQLNLLLKSNNGNTCINQSKIISNNSGASSLSFKSPAFGLANESANSSNEPVNSNVINSGLTTPVESNYPSFIKSAQRSC